jgi:hypothetical protein
MVDQCLLYFEALIITTLTLGLQPKQGAWKGEGQKCNPGVKFTFPKVHENVREQAHTLPNGLSFWELKSQGISKFLNNNLRG